MKSITIGTAGHVDHGKTTLIKALTGIDTDRLKEEKERGMTIDLGFASLDLPNGTHAGIVDVPGHERFIKNMLAGAGGVDLALLVIAADESVMPQTIEHLEILQLLEVKRGVIALTKPDLVDADWIEVVIEDVRKALAGTFLADAPITPVSSTTGLGIPELLAAIQEASEGGEARDSSGPFRLPVDRVFTLTGFGTVVTGTLVAGTVKVGDAAEIRPKGLKTRVRQVQVHGRKVDTASAGSRVAMNLAGLEVAEIERGDVCATPETLKASRLFDLRLTLLKSAKPLKSGTRVRFHIGTAELLGRLTLLDRDEIKPDDQAFAQFRSESPSAAARGDRFVIRSYSPMTTIGGGVIIEPNARRHRRFDAAAISVLETSAKGSPEELLEQELKQSATGKTSSGTELIESLKQKGKVIELPGGRFIHASVLMGHEEKIRATLQAFHEKNPLKLGMPKEELRITAAKVFDSKGFSSLLDYMAQAGEVSMTDTSVSLAGREISLTREQQSTADRILGELRKAELNVPSPTELGPRDILDLLVQRGDIIKVTQDLYFHRETIEQAERTVRDYIASNGKITVSEFRDTTGSTRKYALPILEYFDSRKITRRMGDFRVLGSRL
ncbi:MAG TPA: selenocysteine-specific translation elongation factor [Armatimonadota bacterium]|nr:selenocysteine-specific translation elongation factor [Armatimonadota bacterium]